MAENTVDPVIAQLRQVRIDRGWSQADVGRRLGTANGLVNHAESGRRRVSLPILHRWADIFDMEVVARPKEEG